MGADLGGKLEKYVCGIVSVVTVWCTAVDVILLFGIIKIVTVNQCTALNIRTGFVFSLSVSGVLGTGTSAAMT